MLNCNVFLKETNNLCVDGSITFSNAYIIMQLGCHIINELKIINVDLNNLKHSDSSGLAVISAWVRYAYKQNKLLTICDMPKFLFDLSKASNLEQFFPISKLNKY